MDLTVTGGASKDEAAAIAAVVAVVLAEEAASASAGQPLDTWTAAARVESLGIVRRIPGMLDMRYMGAATRERLTRARR